MTQKLSKYSGRLPAAVGIKSLGILCFSLMIAFYEDTGSQW
jgi:hypothetical protein